VILGIQPARLDWLPDGSVRSEDYNDIYFSRDGGPGESNHVFVDCQLTSERIKKNPVFCIGELGFGMGLNFLNTWQRFKFLNGSRLIYYSYEKHPLTISQIRRSLGAYPELSGLGEELILQYPALIKGFHTLNFDNGKITLVLGFGDALELLRQTNRLSIAFHSWYLDGFSPVKNPEMWNSDLFKEISRLSELGTSVSSYSVAGSVRKNLDDQGFEVKKITGFAGKKEMLLGLKRRKTEVSKDQPWFQLPSRIDHANPSAIIIGGGLAGTAIAHSLASRGWNVKLFERGSNLAPEASGNSLGILMPVIAGSYSPLCHFSHLAFDYTSRKIRKMESMGYPLGGKRTGVLKIPHNKKEENRLDGGLKALGLSEDILKKLSNEDSFRVSGVLLQSGGFFYPDGGSVSPVDLCKANISMAKEHFNGKIEIIFNQEGVSLSKGLTRHWALRDFNNHTIAEADTVILANSNECLNFAETSWLPLTKVRGQLATVVENPVSAKLKCVLAYDGYILPSENGQHLLGATYDWSSSGGLSTLKLQDHTFLIDLLRQRVPELLMNKSYPMEGRVAYRASTSDKMPIIGPVPDIQAYCQNYSEIHHGRYAKPVSDPVYQKGLYTMTGLGSRGIIFSQFGAELVAAMVCDEPIPLEEKLLRNIYPSRFIYRHLKRHMGRRPAISSDSHPS